VRITQLLGGIENYAAAPTAWQLEQIKVLQTMLNTASPESRKLTQEDLPALNKMMNEAGVPHIAIPRGSAGGPPAVPPPAWSAPQKLIHRKGRKGIPLGRRNGMPRKPRYNEKQIIRLIREVDAGAASVDDVARRIGVHPRTVEKWRNKYEGMSVTEAMRLRQLEDENRRLKHALGELTLDNQALREIVAKKF